MFDFTKEQLNFLETRGKVVLHACPGSGKTMVVAQKMIGYLQNWNQPHQGIAVLSFTNVARDEINRQAVEMLHEGFSVDAPHFVGTLDSFIDNFIFLRFGYLLLKSPSRPKIVSPDIVNSYQYWRKECHKSCLSSIGNFRWNAEGSLTKNGIEITCAKNGRYDPPCIQFKKQLLGKGLFFQEEIASLSCILLESYPDVAKCVSSRFPVILLDEAQDTSEDQMRVLDLLCAAGLEAIYVVGDPDQSIYEWRNASPKSFLKKMGDPGWTQLALTENYRSSQLICNATHVFSDIYKDKEANKASGQNANFNRKPLLFLYGKDVDESTIIEQFKKECAACDITYSPDKVAVVTRGRIHSDNDVINLWKTPETELLAKASYEWISGNRSKAYSACEKALFQLTIKDSKDIDISIEQDVSITIPYSQWKQLVIETLIRLPSADEQCNQWVTATKTIVQEVLSSYNLPLRNGLTINDAIKIKTRDEKNPDYKRTPVKIFFETKSQTEYTYSSVHGVKGETYDALMLFIRSTQGATLTPSFLAKGSTDTELMRIAYVAMTRPRKLLVVAMPKNTVNLSNRFPHDTWDYVEI